MKFLQKSTQSEVLSRNLQYKEGGDNRELRELLLKEQHWFCAYTEIFCTKIDQFHTEHFIPSSQGGSNEYRNLYAVTPWANHQKLRKRYEGTLFFQDRLKLKSRIKYVNGLYAEIDATDLEAKALIDYLGLNHSDLLYERAAHVESLKDLFVDNNHWTPERIKRYLQKHPKYLSFPTAIEAEFNIDLTDLIQNP